MDKIKFELNRDGVREIMRSQAMMDICKEYADAALGRLGEGYEVSTHVGKNRVNAEVAAKTIHAKRSNAKHNSILKALGGKS